MTGRVRILPLMIIVLALLFSVKLGNIWHGASTVDFGDGINVQPAMAQQSNEGQANSDADSSEGGAPPGSKPLQKTDVETPVLGDPNRFSEREVQLLQELAERRTVLDAREKQLEEREVLLKAAEQRLVEKQTELTSTKEEIVALLKQQDKQEKAKINQLVAIYENMKPKDAANIFDELEMPVLLQVIKNMKERKVAPVIASMSADKARSLTKELADQRKLPALPN
ncbi:MAG: MotE family protein [Alphaproteobacteria bacterium]